MLIGFVIHISHYQEIIFCLLLVEVVCLLFHVERCRVLSRCNRDFLDDQSYLEHVIRISIEHHNPKISYPRLLTLLFSISRHSNTLATLQVFKILKISATESNTPFIGLISRDVMLSDCRRSLRCCRRPQQNWRHLAALEQH